jgi:uncharacterized protein (DUF58 family)
MKRAGRARSFAAKARPDARRFRWSTLLWAMVFPRRRERVSPTVSGVLLILLSLGIGLAAYNAANNILFITLALLLACLVLSGVLSWENFRRLDWRLEIAPPLRVGHDATVALVVTNRKRMLPTYGLWFDLAARPVEAGAPAKAETTFTARSAEVKATLARVESETVTARLWLRDRLDPGATTRLEWTLQPPQRGRLRVELEGMGSLFPFGFLQKQLSVRLTEEVIVWPAPVEYRRFGSAAARRVTGGERATKPGAGNDLLALGRYRAGDSHRLIHWKASARTRQLLVRQFAAETAEGFSLWLQTEGWERAEQFELLLSFAASLAEDMFRAEKLASVALNAEPPVTVRGVADLEAWLDALAVLRRPEPQAVKVAWTNAAAGRKNLVTFAPIGTRGVEAICDGGRIAAT